MASPYRSAPSARKRELLDAFPQITGYHCKYAMWLLHHAEEGQPTTQQTRPYRSGAEVQEALVQVWNAANRICTKHLIPDLATLVETLEWYGHLPLTDKGSEHLLTMSTATADRFLQALRGRGPHEIFTPRGGNLLKQQIPIRTVEWWNETKPGLLEADLVGRCGASVQGTFLSTLTESATGRDRMRGRCAPQVSRRCSPPSPLSRALSC